MLKLSQRKVSVESNFKGAAAEKVREYTHGQPAARPSGGPLAVISAKLTNLVQDSGSEYGDINETDLDGEELLEAIDTNALKIFPVFFLVFNISYWVFYLAFTGSDKKMPS